MSGGCSDLLSTVHIEMAKQLAQLVMAAGQVVTKAFTNGKARYSGQQNSAQVAETAKIEMMVEEAMMILNLEKMDAEAIRKNTRAFIQSQREENSPGQ